MITENKEEEENKSLQTLRSDMINIMQTMCKTLDEKQKKTMPNTKFLSNHNSAS